MKYLYIISTLFLLFTFNHTYAVKAHRPPSMTIDRIQVDTSYQESQDVKIDVKKKRPSKLKTVLLKMLTIILILAFITFPSLALGLVLLSWVSIPLGFAAIIVGLVLSIWLIVLVLMNTEKRQKRRQARKERREARRTQRKTAMN
ncbi:MAG: hypothetical protein AAF806_31690 [Bacteroidota bacterium]